VTAATSINDPDRSLSERREAVGELPAPPGSPAVERQAIESPVIPPAGSSRSLTVENIMTRNVRSCRPGDTLAAAAMAMCEADCRFLPVVDESRHPVGVVTDGDICLLGSTSHRTLSHMFVRDAMNSPPATCRAADDVREALNVMRDRRIRHLPVLGPDGILEGVVSLTDLVLCAEEEGTPLLRRDLARALREMIQKHGNRRVIEQNPFVED
jgi:CBS domain-containing protein